MKRVVLVLTILIGNCVSASADSVKLNQTSVQGDAIKFTNVDETAWSFSVSINAGNTLAALSLATETPETFSFTQSVPVTNPLVSVGGSVLVGGGDKPAQFSITASVPEPGSMLLLGTCLVGVCGAIRRKLKTKM